MKSINSFLNDVLADFDQFVCSADSLCKLHDSHFMAGNIPDYSDVNIQQLYLLRYVYAYAFEYKYMYSNLIDSMPPDTNHIEVTSIGCGSMVDYWSLTRVVRDDITINYKGVDTVDWKYKFLRRRIDTGGFYCKSAVDFLRRDRLTSDVYIFPKSISEFTASEMRQLADCFTPERLTKDRIYFLFSLRTDDRSKGRDTANTRILYDRIIECGYNTNDSVTRYLEFGRDVKDETIASVDDDFEHPDEIVDYLKNLYSRCPIYLNCANNEDCKRMLGRYPMLRCKYATWQSFSFERRW